MLGLAEKPLSRMVAELSNGAPWTSRHSAPRTAGLEAALREVVWQSAELDC